MSTALSQLNQQWTGYCVLIWITGSLKAFAVSGATLAGAMALWSSEFTWPILLCQILSLCLLCEEWGRIHARQDYCLRQLYRRQPKLAEAIHTALELQTRPPASPESVYFQTRHLETLARHLQEEPLPRKIPLGFPLLMTSMSVVLLIAVIWGLPHLSQSPWAWLSSKPRSPDERTYRILFPAYMRKAPLIQSQLPEQFELPRGSRLEIYFNQTTISDSVREKMFYETIQEQQALNWLPQKNRWIATISPLHSGMLSMDWNGLVTQHRIEVIKDTPPQLTVTWPQNQRIFSNSGLSITFSATDDYGLRQIILYYQLKGKGKHYETIQSFEGQFTEYQETYPWELGATFLRHGDQVTAWIEVSDNDALYGPNITLSDKFEFTIQNMKQYHQNLMARLQQIVTDLGHLLSFLDRRILKETYEKEQAILKDLKELREDAGYDRLLSDELRQFLFSELQVKILDYQKQRLKLSAPPS